MRVRGAASLSSAIIKQEINKNGNYLKVRVEIRAGGSSGTPSLAALAAMLKASSEKQPDAPGK